LLFIDLFLQVEIERCKLQVNEISWVRFFSSNTVNNCCPLMHILVLLEANFLNINKNLLLVEYTDEKEALGAGTEFLATF